VSRARAGISVEVVIQAVPFRLCCLVLWAWLDDGQRWDQES
jgi:hypothetical protein